MKFNNKTKNNMIKLIKCKNKYKIMSKILNNYKFKIKIGKNLIKSNNRQQRNINKN